MIIAFMCDTLASPKLELFVREKAQDTRLMVRILAVALSFESEDEEALDLGKKLLKDARNNGFVLEIMFFRLLSIYMLGNRKTASSGIRDFLGDIVVQLRGVSARQATIVKSNFLGAFDKNLLIKESKHD